MRSSANEVMRNAGLEAEVERRLFWAADGCYSKKKLNLSFTASTVKIHPKGALKGSMLFTINTM